MSGFYWCLKHHRVETDADKCDVTRLLGPYASRAEAAQGLEKVRQRNEAWDEEDELWTGGPG